MEVVPRPTLSIILPLIFTSPLTSSFAVGLVSPTPTYSVDPYGAI